MSDTLKQIGHDYWEWVLRTDPTYATYLGDRRYDDQLADISQVALRSQRDELEGLRGRLRAIGPLQGDDAVSADVLAMLVDHQIEERSHHFEQWNLDQLYGPQVWLQEIINYQPLVSEDDYHKLGARYRAFGRYVDDWLHNLGRGQDEGRLAPSVARDRVLAQACDVLDTPVLASPLLPKQAPALDAAAAERGTRAVLDAVEQVVYPAYRRLKTFLEQYHGRAEVGLWALPGGEAAYQHRIRKHTTTDMTPQQIHDLGLRLLDGIHEEMRQVAVRVVGKPDIQALTDRVSQDAANFHDSREALLDEYRAILTDINGRLGRWFNVLPGSACEVRAIEEFRERDAVAAYYYSPPDDFSRPGVFYANTYQPHTRPRWNMAALTAHEAVPGHHLQIALAMEQKSLPHFRRHGDFTAYIEGWALYAERLADEMGVYPDDLARFGMLTYQAWRATRLVVDTGIHAMRWDRTHAIRFFIDSVGLPEHEIANEVDRYIVWPGQALAYAVGMHEIQRMRTRAEERLGDRFDLRAFHDVVLLGGALPLRTLDLAVGQWIDHAVRAPRR